MSDGGGRKVQARAPIHEMGVRLLEEMERPGQTRRAPPETKT